MNDRRERVVLIRCSAEESARETNVTGIYPPLGLAYLGAAVRETGNDISIIDAEALRLDKDALLQAIPKDAGIIGFSSTTLLWPTVRRISNCVRKQFPNALMIIGGPHVTAFPKETMQASQFDVGVLGEGEATLVELINRREQEMPLTNLPGCAVRTGNDISIDSNVPWIMDLDSLPLPALDLLPMSKYRSVMVKEPFVTMITSRGCPSRCTFCTQIYSGNLFRARSAESIVDEIQRAVEMFGAKEVVFFDETFGTKRDIALRVCSLIKECNLDIRWNIRTRIDIIDRDLLQAMHDAGCYAIHLGIEAGTDRILAEMNKKITVKEIRNAVALVRDIGFWTHGYFMIGYLTETADEITKTLRFSRELGLDWASYTIAIPQPRTVLSDKAEACGLLPPDFWKEYTCGKKQLEIPFLARDEESVLSLKRAKQSAYLRFYMRPVILLRDLTFFIQTGGLRRAFYAALLWLKETLR